MGRVVIAASVALSEPTSLFAQVPARSAMDKPAAIPRTPDGRPDLQGTWNTGTISPLERPAGFEKRPTIPAAEAEAYARQFLETASLDNRGRDLDQSSGTRRVGGYNEFWVDRGSQLTIVDGAFRTSLLVDPPDGRIPPMTVEAQERDRARGGLSARPELVERQSSDNREGDYDNPEQRPLAERCLMGFGTTAGPPALPVLYNNFKQIVQTPDHVMILTEMVHDARVIRIGGEPRSPALRFWKGDSVARWDGDTLVVETTNFSDKTRFRGSDVNLRVTERFTRIDAQSLLYRFTVDDPTTWAKPWTGEYTWNATDDHIYEYACHEGNYALPGILKGARISDKEGAATQRK
jgi:hypothetical protein